MGRELKRVPLDFDWPIDMLWKGYVSPYNSQKCKSCDGLGLNPETKAISDAWYSFDKEEWVYTSPDRRYNNLAWSNHITEIEVLALAKAGRLNEFIKPKTFYNEKTGFWEVYSEEAGMFIDSDPPLLPTHEQVNHWNRHGFGHDSLNKAICVRARAQHLGVYGHCKHCEGEGAIYHTEEIRKLADEWQGYDPPTGDGFQLWNTTTKGHPMTPVFETLDGLCDHLVENGISSFASHCPSKEDWLRMLSENFVRHEEGNIVFL